MSETAEQFAEEQRRISADYNTVFGSDAGRRVLDHLFANVLKINLIAGIGDGCRASYILALHDAAAQIRQIMHMNFDQQPRPAMAPRPKRTSAFSQVGR